MLQIEHLSFDVRDDGRQAEILSDISFNVADPGHGIRIHTSS